MSWSAVFYHRNGDVISTSILTDSPMPAREDEALWQADCLEMNCGCRVQTVEVLHDGILCSTLSYGA